jgi:hypothetical protein
VPFDMLRINLQETPLIELPKLVTPVKFFTEKTLPFTGKWFFIYLSALVLRAIALLL